MQTAQKHTLSEQEKLPRTHNIIIDFLIRSHSLYIRIRILEGLNSMK